MSATISICANHFNFFSFIFQFGINLSLKFLSSVEYFSRLTQPKYFVFFLALPHASIDPIHFLQLRVFSYQFPPFFREFLFFLVRKWKNAVSPFYFFSLFHPPPFLFLFYFRCCRADKFALCSCRWSRRTNERTATVVCGGLISLSRHFGLLGLMLGFNLIIKANKHYPRWWWSSHSFVRSLLSGSALLNIAGLSFYFSFEFLHSNTHNFWQNSSPFRVALHCCGLFSPFLPSFFCSFRGHCGHSNKKRQGTNERSTKRDAMPQGERKVTWLSTELRKARGIALKLHVSMTFPSFFFLFWVRSFVVTVSTKRQRELVFPRRFHHTISSWISYWPSFLFSFCFISIFCSFNVLLFII